MKRVKGKSGPSKLLTGSVIAAFIWATLGPVGQVSKSYGFELPAGETAKAEFHGQVVEAPKSDSLKQVAQAQMSGMVIGQEAPAKPKKSNPLVKIALAIGAIGGAVAYLLVSGGTEKPKPPSGVPPACDTCGVKIDSTFRR